MQPDCVAAINAFIDELKPSGLVVCCRLNEYRWLPTSPEIERSHLPRIVKLEERWASISKGVDLSWRRFVRR